MATSRSGSADRVALLAQDLEQLVALLALAVQAGARLEGGRRACVELEHAVVGGQRGRVVAPLALLDAADLEEELADPRAVCRQLDGAVAQLDRARPVALQVAQPGQVVQHLHLVGTQGQHLLQRGARAGPVAERAGAQLGQLAQEIEAVAVAGAQLDKLLEHGGQIGRPLGAAQDGGQADPRREVRGGQAGGALEQLLGAPHLALHHLERAGGAQQHAGDFRVVLRVGQLAVELGQLHAVVGAAGQAQEIVVARDEVAVGGERGAAQPQRRREVAAARLGHRRGPAQHRCLDAAVLARDRLEVAGQAGRIVAHQVALDGALGGDVAGGHRRVHLAPQVERELRRLGARVAQLGGAAAIREGQPAGAGAVGQLARQLGRLRPQLLAQDQSPAHERGQARAPRARLSFRRGRSQQRRQRGAGRLDIAELGQVMDEEVAGGGRLAHRGRIGLQQRQALGERVAHVDDAEAGVGERDLADEAGHVEGDLRIRLVDPHTQLGGGLAVADAIEEDVRGFGELVRRRARGGQHLDQPRPVLDQREPDAQHVLQIDGDARLGRQLERLASAVDGARRRGEAVEPRFGQVQKQARALVRAVGADHALDGRLGAVELIGAAG